MKEIYSSDARELDSFSRVGYKYTKIYQDDGWMLWAMNKPEQTCKKFELWKYKKHTNPDGSVVWQKPSDESFGRYAWGTFVGSDECIVEQINRIMKKYGDIIHEKMVEIVKEPRII